MASREASALQAPTAYAISLVEELRAVQSSLGSLPQERREERLGEVIRRRKDEATVTLSLVMSEGDFLTYVLNNVLLGMVWNQDLEQPVVSRAPLHASITLQSLRRSCQACRAYEADNSIERCPRQGKYHDIVYKTATKSGSGYDHKLVHLMGGQREELVRCEVDPETGHFQLPPLEAKKCLRQWGEYIARPRWKNKQEQKGDRWVVREVRHHALYKDNSAPGRNDVAPMIVD